MSGVPHDSEFLLASGAPFMEARFYPSAFKLDRARWTESDRNISQLFMEAWANFAKGRKGHLLTQHHTHSLIRSCGNQ